MSGTMAPSSSPFKNVIDNLSVSREGLILLDSHRIVVPFPCRPVILDGLHASHQGYEKTKKWAQSLYYWPNMCKDIDEMIKCCEPCQRTRPVPVNNRPDHTIPRSDAPWVRLGMDLFHFGGREYLVIVDEFSGYPFVKPLTQTTTAHVIKAFKSLTDMFGFPQYIRSDGGPQFRSEFDAFCKTFHITHELSAPYHPQSNGLAEAAVKNMKLLMERCGSWIAFETALLEWRCVPRANSERSPAELFLGRTVRSTLPRITRSDTISRNDKTYSEALRSNIPNGSSVWIYNSHSRRWSPGTLVEPRESGSYFVADTDGNEYLRAKHHVRPRSHDERSTPTNRSASPERISRSNRTDLPELSTEHQASSSETQTARCRRSRRLEEKGNKTPGDGWRS